MNTYHRTAKRVVMIDSNIKPDLDAYSAELAYGSQPGLLDELPVVPI